MKFLSREDYIAQTLQLSRESTTESYRAKYWELAGRALGYLDPPKIENQNIAIFQNISSEMLAFIKTKSQEYQEISTENMVPSLPLSVKKDDSSV
jgi:hypothetical protein